MPRLIVSSSGIHLARNRIILIPCFLIPLLFARTHQAAAGKTALAQGIIWVVMIGCIALPITIHSQGLKVIFDHPEIYLRPVAVFMGQVVYYLIRVVSKR